MPKQISKNYQMFSTIHINKHLMYKYDVIGSCFLLFANLDVREASRWKTHIDAIAREASPYKRTHIVELEE